ncbi:Crp/Fnr family transcriptional regulator [Chloroflexota bacterium]
MPVELDFLDKIPYFAGLGTAELDVIGKLIVEKAVEKGEMLFFEEESVEDLYFVVSGAVKAFKTSAEGKEQILCILRPGDSFNDVPAFDGGPSPVSVQAMTQVVLYLVSKNDLMAITRNYPAIAFNVIQVLAQRVRHMVSLVEDLSFRHVIGRVAKILLENAGDGAGPRPKLTQQEMAAIAGTAREVVGRSLKTLEEEGAIKLDRHRIVISDKKALENMVGASF